MALNSQQIDELRGTLEERRRALLSELREDAAKARDEQFTELAGPVSDEGDQSVASLIADLDQADLSRDLDELRALEAARDRVAEGSYGVCAECGRDIVFERLRANPTAVRCIECQTRYEKTHAGPGGASL
jgi:RNA polymerase-binding transcription factor